MSTTLPFQFASWTKYQGRREDRWAPHYEAAVHFIKKDKLVDEAMNLRTLEMAAVKLDVTGASQEALEYLKDQMVAVNKKIIAANRKAEREGWYTISDELMQKHIAGYKGL